MNEGLGIFLNMDEREVGENEALIQRIDELLLSFGMEYTGFGNVYRAVEKRDRDHVVFVACHALRDTVWLKGKLACLPIVDLANACTMDQIQVDHMAEPSAFKLGYYEKYYQETHALPHGIVVDECGRLRDGYVSYIIAGKYGVRPDIYEAFTNQPLKKVVRGRHVSKDGSGWKIKNSRIYSWNYALKSPVVPGDILKVPAKNGQAFMCVHRIDYVTGKEFCKEHRNVIKHTREHLR